MIPPFRVLFQILLARPLLRLIFGVTVTGRENLRDLDQFILVANHNSHLDVFLLYSILELRQVGNTCPVAARDYFSRPKWLGFLVDRLLRPVWVDRDSAPGSAFEEMQSRIEDGSNILIFPEGTRGEPGHIQEFKTGVARLLQAHDDVPVVPVFLQGPEKSFPKGAPVPLPIWNHVVVGPPLHLKGDPKSVTDVLKKTIEDLALTHSKGSHHRPPRAEPAPTISVLGIDGSGKSTLSKRLAVSLSTDRSSCLITDTLETFENGEPKAMQPLLTEMAREWIGRRAKKAKSLAGYKIPKLTEMLLRDRSRTLANRWYRPGVIVMDGCPLLNMTAWMSLYREDLFSPEFCSRAIDLMSAGGIAVEHRDPLVGKLPELAYLKRLGLDRLSIPEVVIFLDIQPSEAVRRIDSRGEHKQVHETVEKLDRLSTAYGVVCDVLVREGKAHVCRIDGTQSPEVVVQEAVEFVEEIWRECDPG